MSQEQSHRKHFGKYKFQYDRHGNLQKIFRRIFFHVIYTYGWVKLFFFAFELPNNNNIRELAGTFCSFHFRTFSKAKQITRYYITVIFYTNLRHNK